MRLASLIGSRGTLLLVVGLHLHHHFRGPSLDYEALALASAASWIGVPGPGEPVLIAAGVLAGRNHLDIVSVLLVAWAAATIGGVAGWLLGIKTGRALMLAPGPFRRARENTVKRGEQVFTRAPVVAVLIAPSWIAGINRASARIFLPINAISAAAWACGIGLGAYYVGPTVVDFVDDLGWVLGTAFVLLIGVIVVGAIKQQRRRSKRRGEPAS